MTEKARALVRNTILKSNWNAYKLEQVGKKVIVSGLYPFKKGKVIYFPFLYDNCLIIVGL